MTTVQSPYKCVLICTIITIQTGSKESRAPCCVSLFHRRQFSSRARTGSSPFIDRARRLHTTQSPSLSVCGSLVCILLVPIRPDPPTVLTVGPCKTLSVPAHCPRTWSCLCLHWGRREAPLPPTLLVAALPRAGIVELVALSTLEIDIPSLQGALGALLPLDISSRCS